MTSVKNRIGSLIFLCVLSFFCVGTLFVANSIAYGQSDDNSEVAAEESKAEEPEIGDEPDTKNPPATRKATIIPLHEDINPLSGELLKRKFAEAVDSGVDVIILDIYSPGGFTYVTFELMDMIEDAGDVEVVAFIRKEAISGAALVSLACDKNHHAAQRANG